VYIASQLTTLLGRPASRIPTVVCLLAPHRFGRESRHFPHLAVLGCRVLPQEGTNSFIALRKRIARDQGHDQQQSGSKAETAKKPVLQEFLIAHGAYPNPAACFPGYPGHYTT
jgi:hypothetical protein